MAVFLSPLGGAGAQFFDDNGDPLSGGKIYTYVAGTTTPLTTYTTSSGSVAHTNPIILDAAGRIQNSGEIWLSDNVSYKFILKTSLDVLVKTWDDISGISSSLTANTLAYTPNASSLFSATPTIADALNAVSNNSSGSSSVGFLQSGVGAVPRAAQAKLRDTVSLKDFGATGDGVTDDTAAVQRAVTYACGANKKLLVPAGGYRLSASITFPNTSFVIEGEGPTASYFKALATSPSINLFDFTGCSGPAKVLRNIGFEGPATGSYGTGAAIKCSNTNGLYLDNVWMRGILYGLDIQNSSFINCNQCVAEYCYVACNVTTTLDESIWVGWTFYFNETDISVSGAQTTFTIRDFNAINTVTNILLCLGSGLFVDGITVQNNGTLYAPTIINLTGGYNIINNVKAKNFGSIGIFLQGANATKNRFSNIYFEGVPRGIFASLAGNNYFTNFTIKNSNISGVRIDTANENNFSNFLIENCNYGVSISANDLTSFENGKITGSTTADWHQTASNTGRLLIDNVSANFSGIASVTHQMKIAPSGKYITYVAGIPTDPYPFTVGDTAVNRTPAVGAPKGWICTVAGSPGTWVSIGNL